jgi:hypothetical protein
MIREEKSREYDFEQRWLKKESTGSMVYWDL